MNSLNPEQTTVAALFFFLTRENLELAHGAGARPTWGRHWSQTVCVPDQLGCVIPGAALHLQNSCLSQSGGW